MDDLISQMENIVRSWDMVDRSEWPDGPWNVEPDEVAWTDTGTRLDCLVIRHALRGALCGYVGLPRGHRMYGHDVEDFSGLVDVHEGVTLAAEASETSPYPAVRRARRPSWWVGFHCGGWRDVEPGLLVERQRRAAFDMALTNERLNAAFGPPVYRDLSFVIREVQSLAAQLAEL